MRELRNKRIKGFEKAEASLFLSGQDPRGLPLYELIKKKIINGELTYEEAKLKILNYHIEQWKKKEKG
ncbi:antitoxin VbhA family protein [Dickeya solani]|uniref:Antitoxin VbhA family protein n=1 Tax=Dickeya solani TaxID=1089444 RepID=A0AAX4F6N1_9GAMM|nr:antitoxin VbhA family protein [Dickeya solani]WOA54856.1 antitoxin VbhA family protein [Dickeya solani]